MRNPFRVVVTRTTAALATATLLVTLAACGSGGGAGEKGIGEKGTASASAAATLRLGWTPGPAAPQIPVADKSGAWRDAGLNVALNKYTSGREALEAMLGGGLDVAVLAELPVVTASMRAQDVVVLYDLSRYAKYRLIVRKDRGIKSFADLAGKKVAATTGTNMQFMAEQVLTGAKVKAEMVNVAPPDTVAALARGDVDAAFMFESLYPGAKSALGDNYGEIPVSPEIYTGHMLVATTKKVVTERPQAVELLVKGLVQGTKNLTADPTAAQATLASYVGGAITPEYLASVWSDYAYDAELSPELTELMARQGAWVRDRGLVEGGPTPDVAFFTTHIDGSFLNKALGR
jgi:NitT/TauT family transport system substrate-binding protein